MRKLLLAFICTALFHSSFAQIVVGGEQSISHDDRWMLIINQDFSGDALDTSFWSIYEGVPRDYSFKKQKAFHKASNVLMEDGFLKIISLRDTLINQRYWAPGGFTSSDFLFSTGEIWSKHRFSYGKYEARVKIPKGKGLWPAFWLYGEASDGGEIDIFEFWDEDSRTFHKEKLSSVHHMTVHFDFDTTSPGVESESRSITGADMSQDFHIYTLIYTPTFIKWEVDGVLLWQYNKYVEKESLFRKKDNPKNQLHEQLLYPNKPFHIIFNTAIQHGTHPKNGFRKYNRDPDSSTVFPAAMEVDWFRYYVNISDELMSEKENEEFPTTSQIPKPEDSKHISFFSINPLQIAAEHPVQIYYDTLSQKILLNNILQEWIPCKAVLLDEEGKIISTQNIDSNAFSFTPPTHQRKFILAIENPLTKESLSYEIKSIR